MAARTHGQTEVATKMERRVKFKEAWQYMRSIWWLGGEAWRLGQRALIPKPAPLAPATPADPVLAFREDAKSRISNALTQYIATRTWICIGISDGSNERQ